MTNYEPFATPRLAGAVARALFGDRAAQCKELLIHFSPDKPPEIMATFYATEKDVQGMTQAICGHSWDLIEKPGI